MPKTWLSRQVGFTTDWVGKRVLIQGSFYPKKISAADAEHIAEEPGGKVEIPREGYEFNASSVMLLEPTKSFGARRARRRRGAAAEAAPRRISA